MTKIFTIVLDNGQRDSVKVDSVEEAVSMFQVKYPQYSEEKIREMMASAIEGEKTEEAIPVPPQVRWGISVFELEDGSMVAHTTGDPSFSTIIGLLHRSIESTRAKLMVHTFMAERGKGGPHA